MTINVQSNRELIVGLESRWVHLKPISVTITFKRVIAEHSIAVADFKSGKTRALEFLLGEVVRKTRSQVDVEKARVALRRLLE